MPKVGVQTAWDYILFARGGSRNFRRGDNGVAIWQREGVWVTLVSVHRLYFSALEQQVTQPLLHMQCTHGNYTVRGFHEKHLLCGCGYNVPSNSQKTDTSNVSGKRIIALEEVDRKEKGEMNISISIT